MKKMIIAVVIIMTAVLLCFSVLADKHDQDSYGIGSNVKVTPSPTPVPTPRATPNIDYSITEAEFPDDTALLEEHLASTTAIITQNDDETIIEDYDEGFWYYYSNSQRLRVEITRHRIGERDVMWYEADIRTNQHTPLDHIAANQEKPGYAMWNPQRIACENNLVFAISDDMFGHRLYNHETMGICIYDYEVISAKTKKNGTKAFPNLDTCALFPNGTMMVASTADFTADEYLEMGASDVLCFGPYLVHNGEINPAIATTKTSAWLGKERRVTMGYISPYHYMIVYVEGWNPASAGANMEWTANKLQELGCTEAINLDGGHTSAMMFMGKKIMYSNKAGTVTKDRAISGVICIGTSSNVYSFASLGGTK